MLTTIRIEPPNREIAPSRFVEFSFSAGGFPATYSNAISLEEAGKRVLRNLWLFAFITLAGSLIVAAFLVWELLVFPTYLSGFFVTVPILPSTSWFSNAIRAEVLVTIALEAAAVLPLRSAIKELSGVDSSKFRTPSMMTLLMLVCVLVVFAGRVLDPFLTIMNPLPHSVALVIASLLNVAAFGTIVGEILGESLGIWRMGSLYKVNLFKAASIPLIIPIIQVVSPIMIMISLHSISRKRT